jgi:hypothetical protein
MPLFVNHKGLHGWITGTVDARKEKGVYKVYVRYGRYDKASPWWDQPRQHGEMVKLEDCRMISTEQAVLLGLLIDTTPAKISETKPVDSWAVPDTYLGPDPEF